MLSALAIYGYLRAATAVRFPQTLYYIVAFSTVCWVAVTLLTPPVEIETLKSFFRRVHPGGPGWRPVAVLTPEVRGDSGMGRLALDWAAGVVLVYSTLFAVGSMLFARWTGAVVFVVLAAGAGYWIWRDLGGHGLRERRLRPADSRATG